jgi:hypothetical protein
MEAIEDLLEEFRQKTLKITDYIKNGDYKNLNLLLEERQKILDIIKANENYYKNKDIKEQLENKEIVKLDEKINSDLKESIDDVRKKLRELENNLRQQKYHRGFSGKSMFINKKI